jgi:hypothetical protein
MGVGAAILSADSVAVVALWEAPTCPSSAEVKNGGAIPLLPHTSSNELNTGTTLSLTSRFI